MIFSEKRSFGLIRIRPIINQNTVYEVLGVFRYILRVHHLTLQYLLFDIALDKRRTASQQIKTQHSELIQYSLQRRLLVFDYLRGHIMLCICC